MLLVSLYTSRVILKVLGVNDFGIYNVVCGFVSMFGFLNISMSNGTQRFFNYELGKTGIAGANKVYIASCKIQFILALFVIIVSETGGLWFLQNKMIIPDDRIYAASWIFQMAIISFTLTVMQVPFTAAVLAHEKMSLYSIVSIIDVCLRLGIVFMIKRHSGDKLIFYGILVTAVSIIAFLIYFIYCKVKFEEIKYRRIKNRNLFFEMLSFSGWNTVGSFAVVMREQGLNITLNLFFGPVVNAARGIAYQVATAVQRLIENINTAVRPQLIQSYAKDDTIRTNRLVFSTSKITLYFLYLISLPLLLEINYVLNLWLGAIFPEHTESFICIIILTSFICNLSTSLSSLVHATGKMKKYQLITSSIELLIIPLAYIAFKAGLNPESGFIISLSMMIISQIASLLIVRTLVEFSIMEYHKKVISPFLKVVIMTVGFPMIPHFLMAESFLRLVAVCVTGTIAICVSIYLTGLELREKELVDNIVSNMIYRLKRKLKETRLYGLIQEKKLQRLKKEKIRYFRKEGGELLQKLSAALNGENIVFWLDFGTLLGYIREQDFIKYDDDMDIGIYAEDAEKVKTALLNAGFQYARFFRADDGRGLDCFQYKHSTVDVFQYTRQEGDVWCHCFRFYHDFCIQDRGKRIPMFVDTLTSPLEDVIKVKFKNCEVGIPSHPEKYIVANYGENFMTPDPNFDTLFGPPNIKNHAFDELAGSGIIIL